MPDGGTQRPTVPTAAEVRHLRASDRAGLAHLTLALTTTTAGAAPTFLDLGWPLYLAGQLLLAPALVLWFVILHEAGHGTLFRTRRLNVLVGHLASLFALMPFTSWKAVHRLHHKWTGWQDVDPTTEALVPRPLRPLERHVMNFAWRSWLPLFSLLYRARNFWNLPRLSRLLPPRHARACKRNALLLVVTYASLASWLQADLLLAFGPAALLSMALLDPIMLSQHTHIPLQLARGAKVKPVRAREQAQYTRSLEAPWLISRLVLLGFDAHELHHLYPQVPGHRLREIDLETPNSFPLFAWLRAVKCVPAEVFLFQNRDDTGLPI